MTGLKVRQAEDLGPQFVKNPHRMVGQDGAFSISLDDGKALWFFGDTLIGYRVPGDSLWYINGFAVGADDMSGRGTIEQMLTNTGLLLPDQDAGTGLKNYRYILNEDGTLRSLVPLLADEHPSQIRVWCQHGVQLNGKLYLSFIKVEMIPQSEVLGTNEKGEVLPVNFKVLGSGLAVGDAQSWEFRRIYHNGSDILWGPDDPHFGSAIFPDFEEKMLYLYGVHLDQTDRIQKCCLARVGFDDVENLAKYEYLMSHKPQWSPRVEEAITLFIEAPSEVSVSYNQHLGAYLAVHSWRTTEKIVGRTAPQLWGPWSEETVLWTAQIDQKPLPYPRMVYAGKEHPELSRYNGKTIFITYIEFEEYYPHLVRLTLE